MRIAVVGGGPAGLYFATLWKKRHPDAEVRVYEQNPPDATFGFGVVFSDRALEFLRGDDPETHDLITPEMETWQDMTLVHRGETVTIDGVGFSSIGRLKLLQLLQERASAVGADLRFDTVVPSVAEFADADLIIASDGVNSMVRRSFEGDFATSLSYLPNKFAWYGVEKPFDTLTQTFIETDYGPFNAHHYRYEPGKSTFLVECGRETWLEAGFATMGEEESAAKCAELFAETLDGKPLITNKSNWRNFPLLWNDRWSHLNMVLVGDALHTAHFSIGSGTRLAMEDVIALVEALEAEPDDLRAGLERYEAERRPIVEKLVRAATTSARWYEDFADHMKLAPLDFAYSYITRSGRIDDERLRALAPKFMDSYENRSAA
ncbi:MAG: FAD-dependent monooxygenase [Alphaproteobacteria bacterium]|nr:FAD-dependent monooxygenase [Alphaproteobacteria bacterium]